MRAPKRSLYPGLEPLSRTWDVQQGFVEQVIANLSEASQAMRRLRGKAMSSTKGTACAKAQG